MVQARRSVRKWEQLFSLIPFHDVTDCCHREDIMLVVRGVPYSLRTRVVSLAGQGLSNNVASPYPIRCCMASSNLPRRVLNLTFSQPNLENRVVLNSVAILQHSHH